MSDERVQPAEYTTHAMLDVYNGIIVFTPGSARGRKLAEFFRNLDRIQVITVQQVVTVEYLARSNSGYRQHFEKDLEIRFLRDCIKRTDLTVVSRTPIQYFVYMHQRGFLEPTHVEDVPEAEGLIRVDPETDLDRYRDAAFAGGSYTLLAQIRARAIPVVFDGYWEKDPLLRETQPQEEI